MGWLSTFRGASLSLALVFAGGIAVGALGHRFYAMSSVQAVSTRPSPEEWRRKYVTEMNSRVHLSADQDRQLNAILDATRDKFRALNERQRPEMKAIQDEQTSKIRAILSEPQRIEYEKFRAEREAARKERERREGR